MQSSSRIDYNVFLKLRSAIAVFKIVEHDLPSTRAVTLDQEKRAQHLREHLLLTSSSFRSLIYLYAFFLLFSICFTAGLLALMLPSPPPPPPPPPMFLVCLQASKQASKKSSRQASKCLCLLAALNPFRVVRCGAVRCGAESIAQHYALDFNPVNILFAILFSSALHYGNKKSCHIRYHHHNHRHLNQVKYTIFFFFFLCEHNAATAVACATLPVAAASAVVLMLGINN
uniref:Uncharacterized protein n=1 Tax=Glossina austeni TaxID=7395 RepID=A0A1A9VHF7_GLOAU